MPLLNKENTKIDPARKALIKLAFRRDNEKYRYYEPNGKAEEYIKLLASGNFISLLSAANGVGKTAVGANILANLFWPGNNKWFNYPFFNNFPYLKKGRIVSDPTTVEKTIIAELKKWFPSGRYSSQKGGRSYDSKWVTDTEWDFDVMTYEQETKEFESSTLGWAWFDEPPPESIFKATVARMRMGGVIFITATPLTGSAWMYDQIVVNPIKGQRESIEADVEANCQEHGVRGILKHSDIEKMIAEYSEEDKQARVHGKFQHLTGLVFKMFDRKIHVIKPFLINLEDFCIYEALDSHGRNPDAVMWLAINRNGDKFIINEFYETVKSTGELAMQIRNRVGYYRIVKRLIDPSAFNEDQHHDPPEESLAVRLKNVGLKYEPGSKDRTYCIQLTKDALDYQLVSEHMVRAPDLFVFDNCIETIYEFEHWQYNEYTGKTSEKRDPSEKPQDKRDHMMENLGRILMVNPEFTPIAVESQVVQNDIEANLDPYARS